MNPAGLNEFVRALAESGPRLRSLVALHLRQSVPGANVLQIDLADLGDGPEARDEATCRELARFLGLEPPPDVVLGADVRRSAHEWAALWPDYQGADGVLAAWFLVHDDDDDDDDNPQEDGPMTETELVATMLRTHPRAAEARSVAVFLDTPDGLSALNVVAFPDGRALPFRVLLGAVESLREGQATVPPVYVCDVADPPLSEWADDPGLCPNVILTVLPPEEAP